MRVKSVMLFLKASVVASADTDLHNKGAKVKSMCELNSLIMNRLRKTSKRMKTIYFSDTKMIDMINETIDKIDK